MQLNYKVFGSGYPVIILHGLLGSLDNWQSIAKKLAEIFQVFIVDQRNHGRSPHADDFNYQILSDDLLDFLEQQHISKAHLIGHSMGGKVAMKFALNHTDKVVKLVVVDIGPNDYGDEGSYIFKALVSIDLSKIKSREEVTNMLLKELNNDQVTVQFLMKSLERSDLGQTGFKWKFNLDSLWKNYDKISGPVVSPKPFHGETLFIKGEKSDFINSSNRASIAALFPQFQSVDINGAGHWVQADRPEEFVSRVIEFLS